MMKIPDTKLSRGIDVTFLHRCKYLFEKEKQESIVLERNSRQKWQRENAEYVRLLQKKYNESEKGKIATRRRNCIRNRRFKQLCKELTWEDLEEIRKFYVNCPLGYEVDHIKPLSKGGKHHISNLQYLTKEDN